MTKTKPKGYWMYYPHAEQAAIDAAATGRMSLQEASMGAYQAARSSGWLEDIGAALGWKDKVPYGHWKIYDNFVLDIYECRAESLGSWVRHSPSVVSAAYHNGFIEDILEEFGWEVGEPSGERRRESRRLNTWGSLKNRDNLLEISNSYETWGEFIEGNGSAYNAARVYGHIDWLKKHTTATMNTPLKHWRSIKICWDSIKEHGANSMKEWRESCYGGYRGMLHWGHQETLYELTGWKKPTTAGHWNVLKNIVTDIEKHGDSSIQTFRARNVTAYLRMQEMGWERLILLRFNWSKSIENSTLNTYVYWYISGKRIYVGITVDPEGRHAAHKESPYEEVRELALTCDPSYCSRSVEYNNTVAPVAMDRDQALVVERRMIKCAAAKGYEVTNRMHNPQYSNGEYSWKTA